MAPKASATTATVADKANTANAKATTSNPATVKPAPAGLVIGQVITTKALPPVTGRGRRPDPVPADVVTAAEASIAAGGKAIPVTGNLKLVNKLKGNLKKYKEQQEVLGRNLKVDFRCPDPDNKPGDGPGKFEFYVSLVTEPES